LKDITKEIKKRTANTGTGQSDFTAWLGRAVTLTPCLGVRRVLLWIIRLAEENVMT
jgi:hypothetical protein